MTDDLVERLRDKNCCDATKCNCDEAADRIKKLYEYIGAYEDQTNIMLVRIEQLEAALDDVATYLPRAEWHYLKDETLITIGGN